jgi:predicted P-loop ATPase
MSIETVAAYLEKHYRIVVWPAIGDAKGPTNEGWTQKLYELADYGENKRVGILTGTEVESGKYIHDVDIDWGPGATVAQRLLPSTGFVFGRASKKLSHCFYLLPEALPSFKYADVDKTSLLELRGTKINGDIGLQTMVPPSIWSKDGKSEPLTFLKNGDPAFIEDVSAFKQRVCLAAIGMMLAKHFGHNGFGHEARLAWAGFMLRLGIPQEDLILMGEGISALCNNLEVVDVRRSVESTAARMNDPKQKIKGAPALAGMLGQQGKLVVARINEWLGRDSDFIRTKDGLIVKDSQENINRAAQLLDTYFSYDEFSERMLVKDATRPTWRLLDDNTVNKLWLRIDREYRFRPTFTFFEKVIMDIAHENTFHPVRDYLRGLKWDGKSRVDTWLIKYGGADDTPYARAVGALVIIAAVRRVMDPGCKFDEMLILEGEQGINKSSALRALCPNGEWFSDDLPLNVESKQIIEKTLGKWIIEASDLAGKKKAEVDHLKASLSRQFDGPARLAYARIPVERGRQFVIIGTTNSAVYLVDSTGSRRFWPVPITKFDVEQLVLDRDQLWAEAFVREANGESIRLPQSLWETAAEIQEQRAEIDAWEEAIADVLANRQPDNDGRIRVAVNELWDAIQPDLSRRDRLGGMRIAEIMQKLGYTRGSMRVDNKPARAYISRKPTRLVYGELPE